MFQTYIAQAAYNGYTQPVRANHINPSNVEQETAKLAELFPTQIYFRVG